MPEGTTCRRAGFSLIELIVAAFILTVAIILVVGIFTVLLNSSQKTVDVTAGGVLAESLLGQEVQLLTSDPGTATAFFQDVVDYATPTVIAGGSYTLNDASYFYKIYCQNVDLYAAGGPQLHSSSDSGLSPQTILKRLDLELWWWDTSAGSAATVQAMKINTSHSGAGQLQVHMTRLLWPDSSF